MLEFAEMRELGVLNTMFRKENSKKVTYDSSFDHRLIIC